MEKEITITWDSQQYRIKSVNNGEYYIGTYKNRRNCEEIRYLYSPLAVYCWAEDWMGDLLFQKKRQEILDILPEGYWMSRDMFKDLISAMLAGGYYGSYSTRFITSDSEKWLKMFRVNFSHPLSVFIRSIFAEGLNDEPLTYSDLKDIAEKALKDRLCAELRTETEKEVLEQFRKDVTNESCCSKAFNFKYYRELKSAINVLRDFCDEKAKELEAKETKEIKEEKTTSNKTTSNKKTQYLGR